MKKTVLSFAIVFVCLSCFSQKTTRIDTYIFPKELKQERQLIIEMPYAGTDILRMSGDSIGIIDAGDIFVDVVCTDYPSELSLKSLNKKRLEKFLHRFPFLKYKRFTEVNFFRQLDGAEKEKATTMFHGLVIRYRPKQSVKAMQADIENLDEMIATMESDSTIAVERTISKADKDSILLMLRLKRGQLPKNNGPVQYEKRPYDMSATGYDMLNRSPKDSLLIISPRAALKKGLITKAAYKAYDWTQYVTLFFHQVGDTAIPKRKPILTRDITVTDSLKTYKVYVAPDSTLLKIFARTNWKNFTIVEDVTVSMYPYSAQLLLWLKLHTPGTVTNSFVFFNDGNDTPDNEKKIGRTGGIYFKNCTSFDQVKKMIRETMSKGSGGDRPENDIEALILGENQFPGKDFQVLIADNRAPIKDKILSNKLTKPVKIILCGTNDYDVNVDYLNLARLTKGSVHLMEQDLTDLTSLKEGEILKIGKKEYKIDNGYFVETAIMDK
ncbi:MAG: hypothetical protein ABI402_02210 [Ferruginibacter sp.]